MVKLAYDSAEQVPAAPVNSKRELGTDRERSVAFSPLSQAKTREPHRGTTLDKTSLLPLGGRDGTSGN